MRTNLILSGIRIDGGSDGYHGCHKESARTKSTKHTTWPIFKMKNFFFQLFLPLLCLLIPSSLLAEGPEAKPKQFIYVLRLVPRLYSDASWTKGDEAVLGRHLARFKE